MNRWSLRARIGLVRLGFRIGSRFPLRRRVVLATSHLDSLGGNLAAIGDDLARRHPEVAVTRFARRNASDPLGLMRSAWAAARAGYLLATTALFVVDDYFFPIYVIRPRRGTTIVQTWHASGAFKKVGYSVLDKTFGVDETLAGQVAIHSNYDVCLVASMHDAPHYAEAFHQPLERFRSDLGLPRTDVLFGAERIAATVATIRRRYAIPDGRRVVLYAPTFRGDRATAAWTPADLDLRRLQAELGDDHVVLVRLHPFVRDRTGLGPDLAGFAIDVSDHPDINELLHVADILITDYSSVIWEYSLLERPMLFFAPDHAAYERERGFYFDYRTGVPGPVLETTEAVVATLRAGDFDLARVRAFRARAFDVADGHAAERFSEQIVIPALR